MVTELSTLSLLRVAIMSLAHGPAGGRPPASLDFLLIRLHEARRLARFDPPGGPRPPAGPGPVAPGPGRDRPRSGAPEWGASNGPARLLPGAGRDCCLPRSPPSPARGFSVTAVDGSNLGA